MINRKYRYIAFFVIVFLIALSVITGCGTTTAPSTAANAGSPGGASNGSGAAPAKVPDFPTKDITFIVPVSPGGGYDTYSRLVAQYMPKYLPKQVNIIVKNVEGGEWNIGIGEINRAKPDGYTIGIFNIPGNVVNQIMGTDYDLTKMTYIGEITDTIYIGALSPKSKFKSLKDMQNGSEVKVGVVGLSSTAGLGSLIALQEMGVKAKFITHPGSTEAIMAAIRGDVDYVQYPYPTLKKFITDSQQLAPIITFYNSRHKALPDVPTNVDLGYPSLTSVVKADYIVGGTPGIPADVTKILRDAFQQTMKDPDFVKKMTDAGQPPNPATGDDAAKTVKNALDVFGKYKDLVKANMK